MKFNISKEWCQRMALQEKDNEEIGAGGMMWDRERLKSRRHVRRVTIGTRIVYSLLLTFDLVIFGEDVYTCHPIYAAVVVAGMGTLFWCWRKIERSSKEYFEQCARHDTEFAEMLNVWQPPSGGH